MKYEVVYVGAAYKYVEVEADSPEEAVEIAESGNGQVTGLEYDGPWKFDFVQDYE